MPAIASSHKSMSRAARLAPRLLDGVMAALSAWIRTCHPIE